MAQKTRTQSRSRKPGALRPIAWIRHYPGAATLPSQQAVDAISASPDFPRH